MNHVIAILFRNQINYYFRTGFLISNLDKINLMKSLANSRFMCAKVNKGEFDLFKKYSSIIFKLSEKLKATQKLDARAKHLISNIGTICMQIKELEEFNYENEIEFKDMIKDDLIKLSTEFEQLKDDLLQLLHCDDYMNGNILMEFENGVGGNEAMIFTKEMVNFYTQFCQAQGWTVDMIDFELSNDVDGYLNCTLKVIGKDCFKLLQHEAGVHRVQRIPTTDKTNRMHTSTMALKIIPIFEKIDIDLSPKNIRIETINSSGPGGMNVNKRKTAVRIEHIPSNISLRCDVHRTQEENLKLAMKKLEIKLSEMRYNDLKKKEENLRSSQVKSMTRSEKIRTFNFQQDRIVDHRIKQEMSNIKGFFLGSNNTILMSWLKQMNDQYNKRLREEIINKFDD